jgi:hypothetical protein
MLSGNTMGWLALLILGLVLLGVITWWLFRRVNQMQTEALDETSVRRNDTREDDLTKIEGIGPRVEQVLKNAGIRNYEALSTADAEQVKSVLYAAGLQMMNPQGWIEQADLAARGDWDALQKLQDELKGGRRK